MQASTLFLSAIFSTTALLGGPACAIEQHSIEGVREALLSPIPESAIEQARQLDDQLLRTGMAMGTKVYLVTDDRQQRVQEVVFKLLRGIGENPQSWVIRVLDTESKVVNAFVYGGKYIYVFTGLLEQVKNDSELAVVVGHEIGHSVLKHNIRRNEDPTTILTNLAALYGQIKGGRSGASALAVSKALHNGYSRDDEREADAFGVLAAWHAGFDPLGGAGFFSRLERADDVAAAAQSKELEDFKAKALVVKNQCETERAQWASGQAAHTQQNAALINQTCAQFEQARIAYNAASTQQQSALLLQTNMSDHPGDQERVASIAAMNDWLHGARPLKSLQEYPRAYCVIGALVQTKSPVFAELRRQTGPSAETPDAPAISQTTDSHTNTDPQGSATSVKVSESRAQSGQGRHSDSPFIRQWNALDDALESGVITKAEYDRKLAALMAKHRAEQ